MRLNRIASLSLILASTLASAHQYPWSDWMVLYQYEGGSVSVATRRGNNDFSERGMMYTRDTSNLPVRFHGDWVLEIRNELTGNVRTSPFSIYSDPGKSHESGGDWYIVPDVDETKPKLWPQVRYTYTFKLVRMKVARREDPLGLVYEVFPKNELAERQQAAEKKRIEDLQKKQQIDNQQRKQAAQAKEKEILDKFAAKQAANKQLVAEANELIRKSFGSGVGPGVTPADIGPDTDMNKLNSMLNQYTVASGSLQLGQMSQGLGLGPSSGSFSPAYIPRSSIADLLMQNPSPMQSMFGNNLGAQALDGLLFYQGMLEQQKIRDSLKFDAYTTKFQKLQAQQLELQRQTNLFASSMQANFAGMREVDQIESNLRSSLSSADEEFDEFLDKLDPPQFFNPSSSDLYMNVLELRHQASRHRMEADASSALSSAFKNLAQQDKRSGLQIGGLLGALLGARGVFDYERRAVSHATRADRHQQKAATLERQSKDIEDRFKAVEESSVASYREVMAAHQMILDNKLDEALVKLSSLAQSRPEEGRLIDSFAEAGLRTGNYQLVADGMTSLIPKLRNNAVAKAYLATSQLALGKSQEASAIFAELAAREPEVTSHTISLAQCYVADGKKPEALSLLQKVVGDTGRPMGDYDAVAKFLANLGEHDLASQALLTGMKSHKEDGDRMRTVALLKAAGGAKELPLDYMKQAIALDPNSATNYAAYGDLLSRAGRVDDANKQYRLALERAPDSLEVKIALGQNLVSQGGYEEAKNLLLSVSDKVADNAIVAKNLGIIYMHLGDWDGAISKLTVALARASKDESLLMWLAEANLAKGQFMDASSALSLAENVYGTTAWYNYMAARTYRQLGRFEDADIAARMALERSPNDPQIIREAVLCAAANQSYEQTLLLGMPLYQSEKADVPIKLALAKAWAYDDRIPEAEKALRSILTSDQKNADAILSLSHLYADLGRYADAVGTLELDKGLIDKDPVLRRRYAFWMVATKRFAEAEAIFKPIFDADKQNMVALSGLGQCYMGQGNAQLAELALSQAVLTLTEDPGTWAALGESQYAREKYIDAVGSLQNAAKLDPANGVIRNKLAWSYVKLQKWTEANAANEDAKNLGVRDVDLSKAIAAGKAGTPPTQPSPGAKPGGGTTGGGSGQ